jgi:uncharacterized protein YbcI
VPSPEERALGPQQSAAELQASGAAAGVASETQGSLRSRVSHAMVGMKKDYYGKGPTKVQTYFNDNYVFVVMEGGLTRNEETLLKAGEEDLVRSYRLRFQEVMAGTAISAVEEIVERKVVSYHSQVVFNPERAFEIFVLDAPPA